MRLDPLSGLVALIVSLPALKQVAEGRLDVAGAAMRITVVLLVCAALGTLVQSVIASYRDVPSPVLVEPDSAPHP